MDDIDNIKLYCSLNKLEYVSHEDLGDGSFILEYKNKKILTWHGIDPYTQQQKMIEDAKPFCRCGANTGKCNKMGKKYGVCIHY